MSDASIPFRSAGHALPRPIGRVLGRLGARLRMAAVLRGLGTTALVLSMLAVAGMAVDFAVDLPRPARWAIWGAWLAVGALLVTGTVLRPLGRRIGPFDLAAAAEEGHPELGESLTGAVALLETGTPHGSPELIAALADRAARSCQSLRPAPAATFARAGRRLALGLLAAGIVIAPALVRPDPFGSLSRRFLMPWADIDRVARMLLTVAPGDRVVSAGSDLTVTAEVRPRLGLGLDRALGSLPDSAWLEWTDEAGAGRQRIAMEPASASESPGPAGSAVRRFTLTIPRLARSIAYRVASGDATSRLYRITAMEPPTVAKLAARVEPPAYTRRPAVTVRDPARIEAFEGGRITLEITPSRPVRSIDVAWPSDGTPTTTDRPATLADGGRAGSFAATAERSGPYRLTMVDTHGIAGRRGDEGQIIVRPDEPPTLDVRGADAVKETNPDDTVTLAFAARDDVAVGSVEVHYTIRRGGSAAGEPETGHRDVKATGLGTSSARGVAAVPLSALQLRPGDAIAYRLRVADNRPAPKGPNVTWSPEVELSIVAGAEPIAARLARLRRAAIDSAMHALEKDVAAARQDAGRLRQGADEARRGDARWDAARRHAIEERERTLRDLIERLKQLARLLAEDPATRALARPARQIAELEAEAARDRLDRARQAEDPARAAEDLAQAAGRIAAVGERLGELHRRLEARDRDAARRGQLHELAGRQERLAQDAAAAPRSRVEMDRLQARQAAIRNDLDELVRKTPDLRAALLDAEAREADRLARAARDLAGRQRDETRRAGDPTAHAAELKALAESQRAIEDDARRLALEVDPTLSASGRSGLNVEHLRQAADPVERGDVEQGHQHLAVAEDELRRFAADIAEVPADARSLALRLIHRQDVLNADLGEAQNQLRQQDRMNQDEKDALANRLAALGRRQQAIARLVASIKPPEGPLSRSRFPEQAAREAADKTRRAAEAFTNPAPQVLEERKNEARQAIDRLARELPDPWRRGEPSKQKFDEARRTTNELFNQVNQHLRETEPRPDRPSTAARAAEELASRLGDSPDRLAQAVKNLREMEPDPRAEPQRNRAVRAGAAMEKVLRDLRDPAHREAARVALPAAAVQTQAVMDRLERKLNNQTPADDHAVELAADQHEVVDRLARARPEDAADARADADRSQRRIANAIRALNAPDAALDQAEAVRLADRAARALADPAARPAALDAARAAAAAADRLAARLTGRQSPAERASALAIAQRGLNEPEAQVDPAGNAARQQAIAAELSLLPIARGAKQQAAARVAQASELAGRTDMPDDDHPGSSRPTPAAVSEARTRAAEALDAIAAHAPKEPDTKALTQVARRGEPPAAADPELPLRPAQQEAARDLVRRQRQLHDQFLAVLGRHVEPQQAIRADTVALGRELMDLRDRVRPISERGAYPAFEAAHSLRALRRAGRRSIARVPGEGPVAVCPRRPAADGRERRARRPARRGPRRRAAGRADGAGRRGQSPALVPPRDGGPARQRPLRDRPGRRANRPGTRPRRVPSPRCPPPARPCSRPPATSQPPRRRPTRASPPRRRASQTPMPTTRSRHRRPPARRAPRRPTRPPGPASSPTPTWPSSRRPSAAAPAAPGASCPDTSAPRSSSPRAAATATTTLG